MTVHGWRHVPVAVVLFFLFATSHAMAQNSGYSSSGWMNDMVNNCWACDSINNLSNFGLSVADRIFTGISNNLATLLGLLMAVWLLGFASRLLLPFGPGRAVDAYWNAGARKIFHFAIVLGFLQSSQFFWDYGFTPILSASMAIAGNIITVGGSVTNAGNSKYCSNQTGVATNGSGILAAQSIMQQINCPLSGIQSVFAQGIAIGVGIIYGPIGCRPNSDGSIIGDASSMIQSAISTIPGTDWVLNILMAIPIIIVYFAGYIIFPILLVDVILRSIIVAVFSPVALVASLFKSTRHIAHKAIWNLAQSGMTLIFASVAGAIGQSAIVGAFKQIPLNSGYSINDWATLSKAISEPCNSGFQLGLFSLSYYQICGIGLIVLFMLRKSSSMASEFTGSSSGDFSGAVAGAAAAPRLAFGVAKTLASVVIGSAVAGRSLATNVTQGLGRKGDDQERR